MFRVAAWAAGRHKLFCSHTRPLKKALAPYSCRSYSGRYPAAVLSSTAAEAPALRGQEASALHCYSPRASSSSGSSNSSSGNTGTSNRGSDSRVRYDVNRSVTIRVNSSRSSSSSSSFRMEEESFGPFAPRFFSCTVSKNCNHFATSRSYVAQSSNGSSSYCSDSGKSTGNDSSSSSRSSNSNKGSSWRSRQSSDRDTSDDNNCSEEQSSSSDSSTSSSISSNMSRVMSEEIFLGAKIRQQNLCKRVPFRVHRTASGNLPLSLVWSCKRNTVKTAVRKISGDREIFKREVSFLCGCPVWEGENCIYVPGNKKAIVKRWLEELGF